MLSKHGLRKKINIIDYSEPTSFQGLECKLLKSNQTDSSYIINITCPTCGKQFHDYAYHNEFECNKSDRGDMTLNKDFACEVCGKSYVHQRNLSRHVKYECSGQRKFICKFCNKSFAQKCHLNTHVSRIHSK